MSELRTWNAYVSMSKFKQHTINYQSIVGNHITSSVDDIIYRYKFDENIVKFYEFKSIKKIFIGSILGLVIVYFVRFYSLACNGLKSGYEKINRSVDESAYLIGYSKFKTFTKVHVPYLRNSVLFIIILVSLEIIRELPITLILRPFNYETFATTAYIFASQDLLEAAAVPALFLITIASIFILLSSKYILRDKSE